MASEMKGEEEDSLENEAGSEFEEDDEIDLLEPIKPEVTIRRSAPKVGRNEPCPCGSGKKYKKCHGK